MKDYCILVAEDDADDRFLLQAAFKENGFDDALHFVENGVQAMDFLLSLKYPAAFPRLILLDLNMPKKDGKEVLTDLQNHPEFAGVPVIIFSTTHNETEMQKCYDLGATSYIIKPDNFEKLLKIIADIHTNWIVPVDDQLAGRSVILNSK